jgi:hypothetical protein
VASHEICGIAFGTGGHLAVLYTNGSTATLAMRPHASSPTSMSDPLVPTPLAWLAPDAMVSSGVSGPR